MGVVYKACDTKLDRFVALKFLPLQPGQVDEEKRRFVQEAKAAVQPPNPNHQITLRPLRTLHLIVCVVKRRARRGRRVIW